MKVKELHPRSVITVEACDSLRTAAEHLAGDDIGALGVFDAHGARGVFSERDLVRAIADGVDVDRTPVKDYMTEAAIRVDTESALGDAIAMMNEFGCRHLLVDEEGDVSGMISIRDIVSALGPGWPEP